MFVDHLIQFRFNYNVLKGRTFDVRGVYGPGRAAKALEQAGWTGPVG